MRFSSDTRARQGAALSGRFALAALLVAGCSGRVAQGDAGGGSGGAVPAEAAGARDSAPDASAGASAVGGASAIGGAASASTDSSGALLTPVDGWIDGASNPLHVQGAVYAGADERSAQKMSPDFSGSNMCIKGSTAVVDLSCTPIPPAPDCWTTIWGAAIYMNLNQAQMGATPAALDSSVLKGFSFELSGANVPASDNIRFQIEPEESNNAYCTQYAFKPGINTALLVDLTSEHDPPPCIRKGTSGSGATFLASKVARLKWTVTTNKTQEIPYDFCVSDVRALYE